MNLTALATRAVETTPLPDTVTRAGVAWLVARARRRLGQPTADADLAFAREMRAHPIAENTAEANAQHYEVPAAFFQQVLGPRLKYSSALYENAGSSLAEAETHALAETCAHADLADGQSVLELGCGWGSLTLWMAEHYPGSRITGVSNSASQRAFIEGRAQALGLTNVTIVTADMNTFEANARYDRVVSVEMFEHMANWPALLRRVVGWMAPDARLFLHVFTHRGPPYRFDAADPADWIARYFFTGGIMPSEGLIHRFPEIVTVDQEWRWSGAHYRRTALDWLANFDRDPAAIEAILAPVYGRETAVWKRRWRLFFLATAGLFGDSGGSQWGVSHYRLRAATGET